MKILPILNSKKSVAFVYVLAIVSMVIFINACRKNTEHSDSVLISKSFKQIGSSPSSTYKPLTDIVSIVQIQKSGDGTSAIVAFSKHEMVFNVTNSTILSQLDAAIKSKSPIKVILDMQKSAVLQVSALTVDELSGFQSREIIQGKNTSINIEELRANPAAVDHFAEMGVINATTPGLTPAIPDMATAQEIFNYFATQCCQNPGPYDITNCIPYQYCGDGCYARAHMMCYLLNNKYHYATQKLFSFSTGSSSGGTYYTLSVHGEKWCGTCVNWWYHVAPLVTIKTSSGPKAYIFDPSMFDQPVPYATWLQGMENPVCQGTSLAKVTSINVQPTSSFWPSSTTTFDTDPGYVNMNTYLVYYKTWHTCP